MRIIIITRMERNQAIHYNACALAFGGDYRKLEALFGGSASWSEAWGKILSSASANIHPEKEWERLHGAGIHIVLRGEPEFPPLLEEMPHPPFAIYMKGALPALREPAIAIVGTRKATPAGKELARKFGRELSAGAAIVSGLAFGIDSAAHRGCLDAKGITIAILANGLDKVYPASHENLAREILDTGGAIVSEYPIGLSPHAFRLLERNRIVSGLSRAVLVIEAPIRSGAMNTARFATEQNREVFVAPGPAGHPHYEGSHALIRRGATLVTKPGEIFEDLRITPENTSRSFEKDIPVLQNEELILRLVEESGPLTIDEIVEMTTLSPSATNQNVSVLILKNRIREEGGRYTI